jgi:hypothetical protein
VNKVAYLFGRILCYFGKHKYTRTQYLTPTSRRIGCMRCGKVWGMDDNIKVLIPWDTELEDIYRDMGVDIRFKSWERCDKIPINIVRKSYENSVYSKSR